MCHGYPGSFWGFCCKLLWNISETTTILWGPEWRVWCTCLIWPLKRTFTFVQNQLSHNTGCLSKINVGTMLSLAQKTVSLVIMDRLAQWLTSESGQAWSQLTGRWLTQECNAGCQQSDWGHHLSALWGLEQVEKPLLCLIALVAELIMDLWCKYRKCNITFLSLQRARTQQWPIKQARWRDDPS